MIPVENVLFASAMIGAVRGIDPETGHYYDDTRRYIDNAATTRRLVTTSATRYSKAMYGACTRAWTRNWH